ncbi:winged helix-turn-helix transcriptional regulator [Novosphingobium flavum]|uniref:Winged helix-turn-helix transcriptional regulator n=1 Tax=Novosphingobium aerophilum TaxID=2839843 RepID=A0A7X1KBU2_9SPHN|nr:winged helix-turn-helix transcriptional regulator [Novosphingobium aerophilum]MBC2661529.1 winged helix-turn-helix transcriptional regulator [Novosphingobium aerophilum]
MVSEWDGPGAGDAPPPASNLPADLDGIVGFHLRLAHGAVYRHFTETFAALNLTQKQVSVLWLVAAEPGLAQTALSARLQMDRATVMAIVNRLQDRGFVVRGKSAVDGRKQTLHLTPAGQAALAEARTAIGAHEDWLKARFTRAEVRKLIELLARIHG